MSDDGAEVSGQRGTDAAVTHSCDAPNYFQREARRYAGLFPLMSAPLTEEARRGLRRHEIRRLQRYVDRATDALNFLHGERHRPFAYRSEAGRAKRNDLQYLTQRRLEKAACSWLDGTCALEAEGCLKLALKGRSPYGFDSGSPNLATFNDESLRLPSDLRGSPLVEDLCTASVSTMLRCFTSSMLRPISENERISWVAKDSYLHRSRPQT